MNTIVYGIPNCDSVKKARRWLDANGVDYRFHDFRANGLDPQDAGHWIEDLGWETLINRRSSSWKALTASEREKMDAVRALAAVLVTPTLIKRPLLARDDALEVGFSEARYREIFGA